jgi:hypothetical protein
MIAGHAAGVDAAMAAKGRSNVQKVNVTEATSFLITHITP